MTPASDISSLLSSTGTAVTAEMAAAGATNPPPVSTLTTAGCVPVLAVLSPSLSVNQIKNMKVMMIIKQSNQSFSPPWSYTYSDQSPAEVIATTFT